ncbi:MAG: fibrobacter succinogenes major paralogous domain-containing protein [Fibromonadaceae bacterium]|jgi:uncharacterized protein (TIGR02145 family)|nr:fibrobacter succinogenes major paralogous domain-containing protein [Fibromonadaceae bacterium]
MKTAKWFYAAMLLSMSVIMSCSSIEDVGNALANNLSSSSSDGGGGGNGTSSSGSSSSGMGASGEFTDSRDEQVYKYVKIGNQYWMAQNMNYKVEDGSSWCYRNLESNCETYGRLQSWATAKNKVCPSGWHLPSDTEWDTLINFVESDNGCTNCAAKHLKATSGWSSNAGNGLDTYGFNALPAGFGTTGGSFSSLGVASFWWTATPKGDTNEAYGRCIYCYGETNGNKVIGYTNAQPYYDSARCVKN